MATYRRIVHDNGNVESTVANYIVEMPTSCNGHLTRGMGFVIRPSGYSDFVHFDEYGFPYGMQLPVKVRRRLIQMYKDHHKGDHK